MATIYERVEELEAKHIDSGWIPLTLLNGVLPYGNGTNVPRYRKIGNIVYLTGGVKNITARGTTIANLPADFRPVNGFPFVQNTSHENNIAQFIRWNISANGDVIMFYNSNSDLNAEDWYPISCSFPVD